MSQTPEPTARTLRSGTSVRNPRRRPRDSTVQDSVKTAPRRKRSKIDADTFVPPRMADEEDTDAQIVTSVKVNGPGTTKRGRGRPRKESGASGAVNGTTAADKEALMDQEDKENYVQSREDDHEHIPETNGYAHNERSTQMVVRGGRKGTVKRPPRGDGATILTQNARYSVKLLPSTPRELKRDGLEYRGCLGVDHYALAITRERAWIWDYTSHAPVNNARTFDLPFPVGKGETLPFGALVPQSGSETGLLLIHATTAQIIFYESVERAASLGLFQERSAGVEGTVPGLFSGESVTNLISTEQAGFIITLSSGRLIHLLLYDGRGKARISAQYLRATEQHSGGIFGSIRGFLGTNSWKKDVAAVHTRPIGGRGQSQILSMTERAELQLWDVDWTGQCQFKGTIDFRVLIAKETRDAAEGPEMQGSAENLTMLDFAIVETKTASNNEVATTATERPLQLLVLLKVGDEGRCSYMLAEVAITGEEARVGRLMDVLTYHRPPRTGCRPRLCLSQPQHTAIVAFEDAVIVVSLGEQEGDSPEAQLRSSYTPRLTFEDAVFLSQTHGCTVLSACEEDNSRGTQVSAIAFVQGAGLVRFSAVDPERAPQMSRIPAKSQFEQAVFYGALQNDKIIDFDGQKEEEAAHSPEEVEDAALAVSDEILRSTSSFISTDPTSIDAHLAHKAQATHALVSYARRNHPSMSKAAMWQLLWDAERVAAAQTLWTVLEGHVAAASEKKRTATILDTVASIILKEHGEEDARATDDDVRNIFVHHLHQINKIFTQTRNFIKGIEPGEYAAETTLRLVLEANDVWNKGLDAVYNFRSENAWSYGVLPEFLQDGILSDVPEYAELPEFWTSTASMLKSAAHMSKLSRQIADDEWERHEQSGESEKTPVIRPLTQGICNENPGLIQVLCNIYQERVHWLASRTAAKDRDLADKLRANYDAAREDEFRALANVAQTEAGLRLAEKYHDMHTLTVMVVGEMQFCISELASAEGPEEREAMLAQLNDMTARIGRYFTRFGDDWANAYFDVGFSGSQGGMMLRDAQQHWQDALSRYLRADPSRARICWIDDVTSNKDFAHAGRSLLLAAREQEPKLWNKKVELGLAKLSMLATQEEHAAGDVAIDQHEFKKAIPEADMLLVKLQERLYNNVRPEVLHCIDRDAEVEVAMQKFVIKNQDLYSFRQLLQVCLKRLLEHDVLEPADLVDVLTLIDRTQSFYGLHEVVALDGSEFYLALQALNAATSSLKQSEFETMLQLLWKRCYVYDSDVWNTINTEASSRTTEETKQILQETAPWRTLEQAMDDSFFEQPDCAVGFLKPEECLGAGCRPEDLAWRWESADILDGILADNRTHDEQLQDFITSQKLGAWMDNVFDGVKASVLERAEEKAATLQTERDFEQSYVEGPEKRGFADSLRAANGEVNGVRSEAYFEDVDGEEEGDQGDEEDEHGIAQSAEFDEEEGPEELAEFDEEGDDETADDEEEEEEEEEEESPEQQGPPSVIEIGSDSEATGDADGDGDDDVEMG